MTVLGLDLEGLEEYVMFLLNVEFVNCVSVSDFLVSLFGLAFSVTPVLTRTNRVVGSCPHFYQTLKML